MIVEDVFRSLSFGLLSNLSLSNEGNGTIVEERKNQLIEHMNSAINTIYSRFLLRENEVLINTYEWITTYHLDKRYAKENSDRPPENMPYILDLPAEPFSDDAIKIITVRNQAGCELPLNDSSRSHSLFTPMPLQLMVPNPLQDQVLSVVYQATHPVLQFGVYNAEIILPLALRDAFYHLISYHVYNTIGTAESMAKAQSLFAFYDSVCAKIEQGGQADNVTIANDTKFHQRGFV